MASSRQLGSAVLPLALLGLLSACAPKAPRLPAGNGAPFPAFASAFAEATGECRGVTSITAVMNMSGRVGPQRLRGRIDAGLAEPDRLVLEAVAPWGKPYFVLAAQGGAATLVLPRDGRYLRGESPEAIVDALTGIALTPAELRVMLAGCGFAAPDPTAGRAYADGWAAVDAGGTTTWLRQIDGRWRVAAAARDGLVVHYVAGTAGGPAAVRLRTTAPGRDAADVTLRLSDVERNVALDPAVFRVEIPKDAAPLTLEELRRVRMPDEGARRP